jgi:hypothetical protein
MSKGLRIRIRIQKEENSVCLPKQNKKEREKKKEREGDSSYVSLKGLAPHEGGWNPPTVIGSHRFEVWILR